VKCNDFYANTLCNAVTLIFDPLTLNIHSTSGVTLPKSVRNLSKIEQSPAELLIIEQLFCPRYVTLWPWPLITWPWTFVVNWMSHGQTLY